MELVIAAAAGLVVGIAVVFGVEQTKRHTTRRAEDRIRQTVAKCFANSGLNMSVSCVRERTGYLVCIESEPSKKLRFSFIKEQALAQHVERATGHKLTRIFWRFRMKNRSERAPLNSLQVVEENSFDERVPMRANANYSVDEVAWDNLADYVHANQGPRITETQFSRIIAGKAA